jgi:hypothetical protein
MPKVDVVGEQIGVRFWVKRRFFFQLAYVARWDKSSSGCFRDSTVPLFGRGGGGDGGFYLSPRPLLLSPTSALGKLSGRAQIAHLGYY